MTTELYEEIRDYINSLNWADYSKNFRGIIVDIKNKYNLTKNDLLEFEAFQKCESSNNREIGFLNECPICKGKTYMHSFKLSGGKIYYFVVDCECKKKG